MIIARLGRLLAEGLEKAAFYFGFNKLKSHFVVACIPIILIACSSNIDALIKPATSSLEINQLIEDLHSLDRGTRLSAMRRLAATGPSAAAAKEPLIALSDDPDTEVRLVAAEALESVVTSGKLLRALDSPYNFETPKIGPADGWRTASTTEDNAIDGDLPTRAEIAEDALAQMGQSALPALRNALENGDSSERQKASGFAAKMTFSIVRGEQLPPTGDAILANAFTFVPLLAKALGDQDHSTRMHAVNALVSYGADAEVSLIKQLSNRNPIVRYEAARALGKMGPKCHHWVRNMEVGSQSRLRRALRSLLKDPDAEVRFSAAMALQSYPKGSAIVDAARSDVDQEQDAPLAKALERFPHWCDQNRIQVKKYYHKPPRPIETPHVPVFFATDRERLTGSSDPFLSFDGVPDSNDKMHYGTAKVSIPPNHQKGAVERPKLYKFEFSESISSHVTVQSFEHLDELSFRKRLGTSVNRENHAREVLIFIHGYNVSFGDALLRTGVLAYDLDFHGTPVLYSWPSQGRLLGYFTDATIAERDRTARNFREFLSLVRKTTGVQYVHVIAHSMGNRVLTKALKSLENDENAAPMREIVFAAPDIDAKNFVDLANAFAKKAQNYTLYASAHDRALHLSEMINGDQRAGDAAPTVVVAPGVDTIDASSIASSFLGHSYAISEGSFIQDLYELIIVDKSTNQRDKLIKSGTEAKAFWVFQP